MGRLHLVRRTRSHGRGTGPDRDHKTVRGSISQLDRWMELVARPRAASFHLLLRALCLCKHHRTRDGDVYAVSDRHTRRGRAAISRRALARVLLKPRSITDSLRHDTSTDLLRRRLHVTANLVDPRPDHVVDNDQRLEFSRIHVVENSETLVTTTWLDIPEHPYQRNLESKKALASHWSTRRKISNPNSANYLKRSSS